MQKADTLEKIDAAVNKFQPIPPNHPFYVNFENLRGDFQEKSVLRLLNARKSYGKYTFDYRINQANTSLLFLAGMRGSGKTSELAKYADRLHSADCFFVITCNIDEDLDMDNVQYMDIVIYQLEQLIKKADAVNLDLENGIVETMYEWFGTRVEEINTTLKAEGSAEVEFTTGRPGTIGSLLKHFLGLTAKVKAGLSGSKGQANSIRTVFKNNFTEFATKFNTFIEQTNEQLRKQGIAQEILFIIDGLEKTMSADTRRKIIMEESNRIRQIKANTIFTLPIELMHEEQRIRNFGEIITFPFIKIKDRKGFPVKEAYTIFQEFIGKRIASELFDSPETIRLAIEYSGGSPRQLLRIIEQANWLADEEKGIITRKDMDEAINKLGNSTARFLTPEDYAILKQLHVDLQAGNPIGFSKEIQVLLEKEVIFEYNDGTYKRVNPLLERSTLYIHNVTNAT
ncbi:MAG: hypothetical protein MUF71_16085 [Candidatus Kapabacteria bacterium]|nr:hypothetical protein [Candidatus Kapabacteria bacterium]